MIMIADSGSTKTSWRMINGTDVVSKETIGINPYHQTEQEITGIVKLLSKFEPSEIHFYGAGMATDSNRVLMLDIFESIFKVKPMTIDSDLLAAARSTFGKNKGLIGILGTGSNAGLYDGKTVESAVPSLGYVLGDEGSGAYLGKQFIKALSQGRLPANVEKAIRSEIDFNTEEILKNIYNQNRPSKYLASFSKYLYNYRKYPALSDIISESFRDFLKIRVQSLAKHDYPISFVGSVAFYYRDLLKAECEKTRLNVQQIVKEPIDGLTLFHQKSI